MSLSVLLLTMASSDKHITGRSGDRVSVNVQSGELVLCFDKLDDTTLARQGLGIPVGKKCCDGVIFYACEALRVICLVEMKHSHIEDAAEQIKMTYNYLYQQLKSDCQGCKGLWKDVIWRAYVYRSASHNVDVEKCKRDLGKDFAPGNIVVSGSDDITDFLRRGSVTKGRKDSQKRK